MKDSIKIAATVGASVLANFQSREVQMALGNRSDIDVDVQACFHRLLRGELLSEPTVEEIESLLADHFLWNMEMVRDSGIKAGRRWRYREGVSGPLNRHASAEIQSTLEMLDREAFQGCSIQLYLLCTDTQISQLAARVIARAMKQEGQRRGLVWQAEVRVISGLQVLDKKKFEDEGFDELFRNIRAIQAAEPPEAPICLNVTGGYKSILPILTVIGQLFDYPLYYVFQFSGAGTGKDVLLEIPPLPLQFDWGLIDLWQSYLMKPVIHQTSLTKGEDQILRSQLLPHRLFSRQTTGDYRRTTLGTIFNDYIERNTPHGKSVLGFLMEYKFFDFYLAEGPVGLEMQHSVRLDEVEMDILLTDRHSGALTWVEVKSYNQVANAYNAKDKRNNLGFKLPRQLQKLAPDTIERIEAFDLCLYRHDFQNLEDRYIRKNVHKLRARLRNAGIERFRLLVVDIDLSRDGLGRASHNPYTQKLMKKRLTGDRDRYAADQNQYKETLLVYEYEHQDEKVEN